MPDRSRLTIAFQRGSWDVPGLGGRVSVGYNRWTPRQPHDLGAHAHADTWEIHYLIQGQIVEEVAGSAHVMSGGDVLIAPPGVVHTGINRVRHRCGLCWLGIRLDGPVPGCSAHELRDLRRRFLRIGATPFRGDSALLPAFWGLLREAATPGEMREQLCRSYVRQVLSLVGRATATESASAEPRSPQVAAAVAALRERLDFPLRIGSLGQRVGLGRSALTARFVAEMGMTPVAFRMQARLEAAKRLLDDAEVTEVALRLGFSSTRHLAACFHRAFGITPAGWRRRVRSMPQARQPTGRSGR